MKIYRYFQPAPGADHHEWQFTEELGFAPGYGIGTAAPILSELNGFECPLDIVEDVCIEVLTTADGTLPAQSDVDLCVVDNWYECHEATISHPAEPGWVQARACNDEGCSVWSDPIAVSEPIFETALWLGVCICFLLNAIRHQGRKTR